MIITSQLTDLMRTAGYHDVRVIDQPRSSRIVSIGQRSTASTAEPRRVISHHPLASTLGALLITSRAARPLLGIHGTAVNPD